MANRVSVYAFAAWIVFFSIVYAVIHYQNRSAYEVETLTQFNVGGTTSNVAEIGQEAPQIPEPSPEAEKQSEQSKEKPREKQSSVMELEQSSTKKEPKNDQTSSENEPRGMSKITDKTLTKPFTTYLLIMVPILPKSFHSREIIRDTWYNGLRDSKDVMLRFTIGTGGLDDTNVTNALATENSTHGDLIYFDKHKESRTALTEKTLLLMQWAYSNVKYSYFLKCDDDTFVFVERVIKELKKRPSPTRLYYGRIQTKGKPNPKGEWADTEWNLGKMYLPFALGGGYILSSDLITLIVENIDYLQWHPNEDTAVGSWLAPYKIERKDDKLVCMSVVRWKRDDDCPHNHIIHLFNGIKQNKLDEIFYIYAKERNVF